MNRAISSACALILVAACGGPARETRRDVATTSADVEPAPAEPAPIEPAETAAATTTTPTSTSDPRMDAIVAAHNERRAQHCAPPLAWSDEVAQHAQAWADHIAANGCQLEHSQSPYGENLAAGTSGTLSPEHVVEMWYREISDYHFRRGGFSMSTGHFTQLAWVGTARVGCGTTTCNGLDVWVCNYDPPGNVQGQYRENVLPTSCR